MSKNFEQLPELEDTTLVIRDGENLLVIGSDKRSVVSYMRSKGILGRAQAVRVKHLAPMLRTAAQVGHTVSETIAETGLWVKLTEESAEAKARFGLIDSDVPGVSYAVAGNRGDIKQWLKLDTSAGAKFTNPSLLSGLASGLTQAASQAEAERLHAMLASLNEKLDQLLRDNRDDLLGDIGGIEEHLRDARTMLTAQGEIDSQTWDTLAAVPLQLKQIRKKAVLKLEGVADNMVTRKKIGDLRAWLPKAEREVRLWLSTIARSIAVLDDFAVLELEHTAAISPGKLDAKRRGIQETRATAIADLTAGVAELMKRMSETAGWANKNVLVNHRQVPKVLASIEESRGSVGRLYEALDLEMDWESLTPEQWLDALKQAQQWKNALTQGGAFVKENGGPVARFGIVLAAPFVANKLLSGKGPFGGSKTPEA
ncbi:hypothetical protein C5C41_07695 [Rathayibacter sp. AY1E9]|uniref:hypothetical protein n=1 Tax=unclassified Rathayibacter TaxID=2609250 RepID=UPI000CE75847|nr:MULTISPECIES: hypothetical protein [unclassified Rathayibacter]PPG53104.1 hypothetical protein C5C41_07695 [Rathayibacter sp. AY1E9]PPG58977.1 hypothetical protein C5C57_08510 [Rathayibacter sp. AY1C5]